MRVLNEFLDREGACDEVKRAYEGVETWEEAYALFWTREERIWLLEHLGVACTCGTSARRAYETCPLSYKNITPEAWPLARLLELLKAKGVEG